MRFFYVLIVALALTIFIISLNEALAQDDMTISGCQSRCLIRVEAGFVVGNYQAAAACRERCVREYWEKFDRQLKKGKSSLFDD